MHALQLAICKATCSANELQPLHSPSHIGHDEYNDDNTILTNIIQAPVFCCRSSHGSTANQFPPKAINIIRKSIKTVSKSTVVPPKQECYVKNLSLQPPLPAEREART